MTVERSDGLEPCTAVQGAPAAPFRFRCEGLSNVVFAPSGGPEDPGVPRHLVLHRPRSVAWAITGRSGSGTSTILRCIWRTNLPEHGRILYDSARFGLVDIAQATQRQMLYLRSYELGYVSQFLNALPRQTARDIVLRSALEAYGATERERAEAENRADASPLRPGRRAVGTVSAHVFGRREAATQHCGGHDQAPRLLLLDEPTASLDNASKLKVRDLIQQLKAEGTTMLGILPRPRIHGGDCAIMSSTCRKG